jgi:hypothetical protein
MNIHIHIEHLILDGIDVPPGQGPLLQATVTSELTRLLRQGGLAHDIQSGCSYPTIQGGTIDLQGTDAAALAPQIAHAVYEGISQ